MHTLRIKLLLLIYLSLINVNSFAGLNYYHCANEKDQTTCTNSCVLRSTEFTYEYKVNTNNNAVIENTYQNNILIKSEPLENCSVVDSRNWVCNLMGWSKSGKKDSKMGSFIMTNGVNFYKETPEYNFGNREFWWCKK